MATETIATYQVLQLRRIRPDCYEGTGPITSFAHWSLASGQSEKSAVSDAVSLFDKNTLATAELTAEVASLDPTPQGETQWYAVFYTVPSDRPVLEAQPILDEEALAAIAALGLDA
jgi:hypothetical protein